MKLDQLEKQLKSMSEFKSNIESFIGELNKNIEEVKKDEMAKIKDPVGYYRPPIGGNYWCINAFYNVSDARNNLGAHDVERLVHGNSFETQKQAEHKRDRDEAAGKLKRAIAEINAGDVVNWENENQKKYFLYFDHRLNSFSIDCNESIQILDTEFYCFDGDKLLEWANANEDAAKLALGIE